MGGEDINWFWIFQVLVVLILQEYLAKDQLGLQKKTANLIENLNGKILLKYREIGFDP